MRAALPLALLGLVAACAEPPAPPPPVSGGRMASAAPATPAASGPVTTFDGRYRGAITLNPDRTRRCPDGAPDTEMTVRGGRATLVVNPATRQTLTGTVGADGTVRLTDALLDRSISTTGVFSTQGFVGEYRNGLCTYVVNLRP